MSSKKIHSTLHPLSPGDRDDDDIVHSYSSIRSVTSQSEPELELRRPYEAQTPTKYRQPLTKTARSPLPRTNEEPRKERPKISAEDPYNGVLHQRPSSSSPPLLREFQRSVDYPSVQVRRVHVRQRSAFGPRSIAPLIREWEQALARCHKPHRLSPSYPLVQFLHETQHRQSVVRQVQFSPSTGRDADFFVAFQSLSLDDDAEEEGVIRRDGRYRSIQPQRHWFRGLNDEPPGSDSIDDFLTRVPPPRLSCRKHRLPNRADVGFGPASETERQEKQEEIRQETTWEEARLRLAVAVTSDDLGGASFEEILAARPPSDPRHVVGPHLRLALARNARHFAHRQRPVHDPSSCPPNPYSMLAPPLDSTYSPSQGWRPRAFHDRPAGLRYCYVVPTNITLWNPPPNESTLAAPPPSRMGSLSLYTLPPLSKRLHRPTAATAAAHHCSKSGAAPAYGKVSEAFWFPIGSDVARSAVFSFYPQDLVMESSSGSRSCGPDSLYVVLQVYEIIPLDNMDSSKDGTELLKCVAFGVTKAFSDAAMMWPEGHVKELQLYSALKESESQQSFVERLWSLVHQKSLVRPDDNVPPVLHKDDLSIPSTDASDPSKNGLGLRMFRSPKRSRTPPRNSGDAHHRSRSVNSVTAPPLDGMVSSASVKIGNATLCISYLNSDFLQCMLTSSHFPESSNSCNDKLLVDVSGDCAVRLDSDKKVANADALSENHTEEINKRSNLVRLPLHDVPAGYTCSQGCREVLYLPARPEKHYDVDSHMATCRSFLNLLYIYPCLLRTIPAKGDKTIDSRQFTVRIRILHDSASGDHATPVLQSIPCFYNYAPWNGNSLLHSMFTNILETSLTSGIEMKHAIRDEIKVRLPEVLDGNFKIEFTLFSVERDAVSSLKLSSIAEALIPLTSSKSRDPSTGIRVATIIPNGKHRLELGRYQLHFETRLVSSLHISDPVVAAAVRSGMCFDSELQNEFQVPNTEISRSYSGSTAHLPYTTVTSPLLASTARSSIVAAFQVLLHLQLSRLLESESLLSSAVVEGMGNIVVMIAQVKHYFLSLHGSSGTERFNLFVKVFLDLFDESWFSKSEMPSSELEDDDENVFKSSDFVFPESQGADSDGVEVALTEIDVEDTSVRLGDSQSRRNRRQSRPIRQASSFASDGQPFSRSAFGASKLDRIRAIAEIRHDSSHYSPFFDDDETIATSMSLYSGRRGFGSPEAATDALRHENRITDEIVVANNSLEESSVARPESVSSRRTLEETEFVRRVRIAASMVIAPCVNPSLSTILKSGASPTAISGTLKNPFIRPEHKSNSSVFARTARCLCSPGSDIEQDPPNKPGQSPAYIIEPDSMKSTLTRGRLIAAEETVSVTSLGIHSQAPQQESDTNRYLYESIIKSFLQACTPSPVEDRNDVASDHSSARINGSRKATFAFPREVLTQIDFILPLCMKSIVLRYRGQAPLQESKVMADESQVLMLESFVGVLAEYLMNLATESSKTLQDRENSLAVAVLTSHVVLDFLTGLICVFHSTQIQGLLIKYFATLREAEKLQNGHNGIDDERTDSTDQLLHRVVSSRQLRLFAAETFATLPCFLALNLPMKYSVGRGTHRSATASWLKQYVVEESEASCVQVGGSRIVDASQSGWLAHIILKECFLICSRSSKSIVEELLAVSHTSTSGNTSAKSVLRQRSKVILSPDDVLLLHTVALHAVHIVYELVVRRHSLDRRFQSESAQTRIAGLLTQPIVELSCANVRWLGKLDSSNAVRSSWLLCFIYVLQEAPEALIYDFIHSCCEQKNMRLHNFIQLLSLCCSTFQHFLNLQRFPSLSEQDRLMSPWLLQESFNTICAASIVIVDICLEIPHLSPHDSKMAMQGITELLLDVLTTPQSPVTHLRALGAALQVLEASIDVFLDAVGDNLQHWFRVLQSLMNSHSLSVRSIAVDFLISLLCEFYDAYGTVDAVTLIFATVLPEVISREIAMYSVDGHVTKMDDVAKSVWPIRRSLADIGDAHPSDDSRVDPLLPPILTNFCRACQAIIDGVLVELRLQKDALVIVGKSVQQDPIACTAFDAEEESLYEAASFFAPETAPMQRMRWLLTLKRLHASRNHWVEAAECLFLCSHTICDAVLHLKLIWRPSRFLLWSDPDRSSWLHTIGDSSHPGRGNAAVIQFAESFLEPSDFLELPTSKSTGAWGKIHHPSTMEMCTVLPSMVKEAMECYGKEFGFEPFAYRRWESIVKAMMSLMTKFQSLYSASKFRVKFGARMKYNEEVASLQTAWTKICGYAALDRLHVHSRRPFYVTLRLYGKKPSRFEESTTIPTFLEWDKLCVCRVPSYIFQNESSHEDICLRFAQGFRASLCNDVGAAQFVLRTHPAKEGDATSVVEGMTYMDVFPVYLEEAAGDGVRSSSTRFRSVLGSFETTVAREFPGALSRQTALVTTELVAPPEPTFMVV